MAINTADFIEQLKSMTILEVNELVQALQTEFGVSAVVAAGPATGGPAAPVEDEKTEFDVVLVSPGDKKIQVIKVIRDVTGLGLKEAKEIADTAPKAVKTGVSKDEADKLKAQFEAEGATIELK
ncbi:50S ribosomal protein L7/L12 [Armatimonas rosea]|uniref:Large ribosomal subunit protein bL12 n=1 Tax=Armatimonas rosea TaxID=685828 RepID=A0A7W9W681_ARMRO|nr:50S ribosomal protein L7/L12 [Armatimonas rosea]MBB6050328.1 large subunit ribosomal protein L7/L12 [Armatimonas rosea]